MMPLATPPESICLLRLSALGDVTHVLPTLRTLQHAWPTTRISWIIGTTELRLVGDIPGVEFIPFDKQGGLKSYLGLWRRLRGRRYDLLLHLQVSLRASLASLCVRAPLRLGYDRARAKNGQWLFTNRTIAAISRQHVLDSFLEFPRALGLEESVIAWDIPIPESAHAKRRAWIPGDRPYLVINPCSSARLRNWRNWDVASYAAVIDHAADRYGLLTVLTGGPAAAEVDYARKIAAQAGNAPLNLVGQTNLKELLAVLAGARAVIAPDTGPAHMAGAVGTPVIGLYASSNPERTGPYRSRQLTVNRYPDAVRREFGRDVVELPWGQRVRRPDCMSLITPEEVCAMLERALALRAG